MPDEAFDTGSGQAGMKIGITCYPTYGGSGIVATELGKELAERGHEIHFISYAPPMRLTKLGPRIHFHEVEVTTYPLFDHPPYTLALATKMAEVEIISVPLPARNTRSRRASSGNVCRAMCDLLVPLPR